ncbi:MAG: hypothetical protein EZS28_007551 [Streblomastix strix]|uniref:Uncharacterized protein n=1 Tax=Streblomastix strix TaxID=222440 RepID=A0A5J4WQC6_9EUKA|nr:MAG: hypothetical protein EZS28_007551 [Streblomastix strix]
MQVWRHEREKQPPETPPSRRQTQKQHQQLGGKLMRMYELIESVSQYIKNTQRYKINKIMETAAPFERLNFLRTQFIEASLYLVLSDSTKTRAVKTQGWTGKMISPIKSQKKLYWSNKKIVENKKKQIQNPIPQTTIITDASPKQCGQLSNKILEKFLQFMEHSYASKHIGHIIKKNCRLFTQEQQQLSQNILFKKTKSDRHFSNSNVGDLRHISIFEYENNNVTCTGKDKHNSRYSQKIVQIKILSLSPNQYASIKNDMQYPSNFRSICINNSKTVTSVHESEHNRLISPMDKHIIQYMDKRNPINITSNSNIIKRDFIPQQRGHISNSSSTIVLWPAMIYKLNESIKQVPYHQTVKPMLSQGSKHGKSRKFFTTWKDSSIPHGPEVEKGRIFLTMILNRN